MVRGSVPGFAFSPPSARYFWRPAVELCLSLGHEQCRQLVSMGAVKKEHAHAWHQDNDRRSSVNPALYSAAELDEVKQRLETGGYEVGPLGIHGLQSAAIMPKDRHADAPGARHIGR
jgi:hypothetical protein